MGYTENYKASDLEEAAPLLQRNAKGKPSLAILFRYIITSIMVFAHLGSFIAYLCKKFLLYAKEYRAVAGSPWLALILVCECGYFISSFIACIDLLLPPKIICEDLPALSEDCPSVDILIPCCREPTDVCVDTILAALAMDYPQDRFKVLVLDDGEDDDLRIICQAFKAQTAGEQLLYLRRSQIHHHFKCGNLNYGLRHSLSEYVVMMDADMILHPSFLRTLLPHIVHSPQVSFVQIPQSYYNLPIGDPLNDASVSYYQRVLVQRNTLGFASCVGTGAIFRREHLDHIGGFQPQSITEDTMTAFALFNKGYKSVYLNKNLQIGLTPWTLEGYLKQRQRWCVGAIQQFSCSWKAMLGRTSKLTFLVKISYFWHTGYYYLSILNVIMMIVFLSILAFQLKLNIGISMESRNLMLYLAAYLVIWRLTWIIQWWGIPQQVLSRNREESHFWWMTPFFLQTVMRSIFAYKSTFNFIPTSSVDRDASKVEKSSFAKILNPLKPFIFHLTYVSLVIPICMKSYIAYTHDLHNCEEAFLVGGISIFLFTTSVHMLVPFFYVIWPTSFPSGLRSSLLKYGTNGVPQFSSVDCIPKWHWPVVFYEILSYSIIFFWCGVFCIILFELDAMWCKK